MSSKRHRGPASHLGKPGLSLFGASATSKWQAATLCQLLPLGSGRANLAVFSCERALRPLSATLPPSKYIFS